MQALFLRTGSCITLQVIGQTNSFDTADLSTLLRRGSERTQKSPAGSAIDTRASPMRRASRPLGDLRCACASGSAGWRTPEAFVPERGADALQRRLQLRLDRQQLRLRHACGQGESDMRRSEAGAGQVARQVAGGVPCRERSGPRGPPLEDAHRPTSRR